MAGKQPVFAIDCDRADGAFDDVGVHLDTAVLQEAYEAVPVIEPVADRLAASRDDGAGRSVPSAGGSAQSPRRARQKAGSPQPATHRDHREARRSS